jgi:hypothetical protein
MIIKTFDQGWGREYPLKQYEQQVVDSLMKPFVENDQRVVMINSVWYTSEMHDQVITWLRNNDWDQIVLIAMLDAAIPYPDRYTEFNRPVTGIGYYPGAGQVDFCALFVDHFLTALDNTVLLDASTIDTAYMCLNRKPHWHRQKLYNKLQAMDLVNQGIVSMGGDGQAVVALAQDRDHDTLAPNATRDHYGIPNDIVSLGHQGNWQRHLLNVVTETFYDINRSGFVSEKIYKPIVGCRPFLVYDPDGGTQWLRDRGFESYTNDFRDISDLDLAEPHNIPQFLKVLCEQTPTYWQKKFVDLQEKILYNKAHFADYVRQQQSIVEKGIPCLI